VLIPLAALLVAQAEGVRKKKPSTQQVAQQAAQHAALKDEIEKLTQAQEDLGSLQSQDGDQFKSYLDEIDRLVARKHQLTDASEGPRGEAAALEREAASVSSSPEQAAVLREAAVTIQGSGDELRTLNAEIEHATEKGREIDSRKSHRKRIDQAVSDRLRLLRREEARLDDKVESANDFASFQRAGEQDDSTDADYEADSASGLEAAIGWSESELESDAQNAEESLSAGIKGGHGSAAVNVLKGIGR